MGKRGSTDIKLTGKILINNYLLVLVAVLTFLMLPTALVTADSAQGFIEEDKSADIERELNKQVFEFYRRLKMNLKVRPEFNVKGIYVSGWVAGLPERMDKLIRLVDETELNAMVIDIKDSLGYISYQSDVELARSIASSRDKTKNMEELLDRLHKHGIYTIARLVVFKDRHLASQRRDLALPLKKSPEEIIYSDEWVNPDSKEVQEYNIELAREAINMGFKEIQFDYIRYPATSDTPLEVVINGDRHKSELILEFLTRAHRELGVYGNPISIDVFGLTTSTNGDLGIGQNFRQLSENIDIISPMVYPSHYSPGSFGIGIPEKAPYQTVYQSMIDARKQIFPHKDRVRIRPWLQDFTIDYEYNTEEILAQIRAVQELGIEEWLLWNPRSQYTREALEQLPLLQEE